MPTEVLVTSRAGQQIAGLPRGTRSTSRRCSTGSSRTYDRAYLKIFHQARVSALTPGESASLLARRPYDLRHAAVSTWLNAGVPAPQVAEWAGHSVDVLLRVYAKCISGQKAEAMRRIEEATRPRGD
jgi:integrase